MPLRGFQPLVEVFLLVEQPRQRLSHWSQALAPLDAPNAPPVATVDAYYDPTSNQAIFGLRYHARALGPERLRFIVEVALLAEIGMIQPAELSEGDRRRFIGERLASCTLRVGDQRTVVSALVELVRRIRGHRTSSAMAMSPALPRARSTAAPGPRGDTAPPLVVAKGTRDDAATERANAKGTRDLAQGSVRQSRIAGGIVEDTLSDSEGKRVITEPIRMVTPSATPLPSAPLPSAPLQSAPPPSAPRLAGALLPQRRDVGQRPSPNVIARAGVHRANTVMMPPGQAQQMFEATQEPEPVTDPYMQTTATDPGEPGVIDGRYLRGGRWVPLRIAALSLKGAALMAGVLPRVDDRVDVALAFANHRALVRGAVAKVSTMQEAETTGTTTFHVSFELDDGSRRELTALLTAARAANVTIKPPPPRSTRRYPVEWPIALGTTRGAVRADALDVSTEGMFVRPQLPLDAHVTFSAVLDDGQPVSGRARVVREIAEAEARARGRSPGYGLSILEMPERDRRRWHAFVIRIEKRSSRRVLVGAVPPRLVELQATLVAAGYAVTGGSEPSVIAQLASADAQPVDAALIDAAWLVGGNLPSRIESLFASHSIPCVTMHGDARRARAAIDRLLAIV